MAKSPTKAQVNALQGAPLKRFLSFGYTGPWRRRDTGTVRAQTVEACVRRGWLAPEPGARQSARTHEVLHLTDTGRAALQEVSDG